MKEKNDDAATSTIFTSILSTACIKLVFTDPQIFVFMILLNASSAFVFSLQTDKIDNGMEELRKCIINNKALLLPTATMCMQM